MDEFVKYVNRKDSYVLIFLIAYLNVGIVNKDKFNEIWTLIKVEDSKKLKDYVFNGIFEKSKNEKIKNKSKNQS